MILNSVLPELVIGKIESLEIVQPDNGDIFKSLNQTIVDTYLGDEVSETRIPLSIEDKELHFEWCWKKTLENFEKENIRIRNTGDHKDYFKDFFMETFYNQGQLNVKNSIPHFIIEVFDLQKQFTKSA